MEKVYLRGFRMRQEGREGYVRAAVSELDTVNKEETIVAKGGLIGGRQNVLLSAWNHSSKVDGVIPVGKGVVYEEGNTLIAEANYNLRMSSGRDAYEFMLDAGDEVEWSIALLVAKEDTDMVKRGDKSYLRFRRYNVDEVSPVDEGVSYGTSTLELQRLFHMKEDAGESLRKRFVIARLRELETAGAL